MILPNSEFIVKPVVNWTAHSRQVRVRLPFSLPNSVDPAEARRVLLDAAAANPDVLGDPPPEVALAGFAGKDVNYELRVWTSSRVDTHQAFRSDLNFAIFAAFRNQGLVTPDPPPTLAPAARGGRAADPEARNRTVRERLSPLLRLLQVRRRERILVRSHPHLRR